MLLPLLIMQSGLKGPDQRRLAQPENTRALFVRACAFVFRACVMHSNEGATSQSHSELPREYVKCHGNVFISVSAALRRSFRRRRSQFSLRRTVAAAAS